eukprot:920653-Pelagomonas_calceolata.AAC.1
MPLKTRLLLAASFWSRVLPVILQYMYLDLPHHVLRNTARFRLRVLALQVEQAIWSNSNSPVCDICDSNDMQDENMCCSDVLIPRLPVNALTEAFWGRSPPFGG